MTRIPEKISCEKLDTFERYCWKMVLRRLISELNLKIELLEKDYQSDLEIYHKLREQIKIYQNSLEPINYGLYKYKPGPY